MKSLRKALTAKAKVVPTEGDKQRRSRQNACKQPEAERNSWANLPPEILGSIFERLKINAASSHGGVFSAIKTPERAVIAMGISLSAVCKAWRDEAYIVFQQDAWQQDMIMQPQQCLTLAPEPLDPLLKCCLLKCCILAQEDTMTRRNKFYLYQELGSGRTYQNKLLMTAEFYPQKNCILIYQGRKESWRTPQALCAVIEINLLQSKYSLYICKRATERRQSGERPGPWKVRLDESSSASIESIDRVASIWLPKRLRVSLAQKTSLAAREQKSGNSIAEEPTMENVAPTPYNTPKSFSQPAESRSKGLTLVNRKPQWKASLNGYCLNFRGRVQSASIKNFQLVDEAKPQELVMQFGKAEGSRFSLDFQPAAISAVQAFAIALTKFSR